MNTLQNYVDRYDTVIKNLGYSGEAIEVLKQLLANASYISEVEHAAYMAEASLEKASLMNSKIQHCVDRMYSVFRGSCPRIVFKIKPTKYLTLNPFDVLITSQNFNVYYLGYYRVTDASGTIVRGADNGDTGAEFNGALVTQVIDTTDNNNNNNNNNSAETLGIEELLALDEGYQGQWVESSATFYPALGDEDIQIIKGFIAPKRIGENLTIDTTFNSGNTYYVDCPMDNLSNDVYIEIDGQVQNKTRIFAEHVLSHKVFDLTLPSFGSRLYVANYYKDTVGRSSEDVEGITENSTLKAQYYGYSTLDSYNETELGRLQIKGAELIPFIPGSEVLRLEKLTEFKPGMCLVESIAPDSLNTIHYKANRDRYVNSILRSNSDIGTVLEETYPEIVMNGGTSYYFQYPESGKRSSIDLYYIPKDENIVLSEKQIEEFSQEKRAYYVITSALNIQPGTKYVVNFDISLELFKNNADTDYDEKIGKKILVSEYEKKFGIKFGENEIAYIESLISKLTNVKRILGIGITYKDTSGRTVLAENIDESRSYYEVKYSITTSVTI